LLLLLLLLPGLLGTLRLWFLQRETVPSSLACELVDIPTSNDEFKLANARPTESSQIIPEHAF